MYELEKIQNTFLWNNSTPKIKHKPLCNDYKAWFLKNVDIPNKIILLQCSWKLFWTGKKHLVMMVEIPFYILSQYLWYNKSIQVDKASVHFLRFSEKVSIMFRNFLVTMVPTKNGMKLRENKTYIRVSHRCWEHGGSSKFDGGGLSQYMGGAWGDLECCQKYLWRSSFDSNVASYKPASLQIY